MNPPLQNVVKSYHLQGHNASQYYTVFHKMDKQNSILNIRCSAYMVDETGRPAKSSIGNVASQQLTESRPLKSLPHEYLHRPTISCTASTTCHELGETECPPLHDDVQAFHARQ